MLGVLYRYPHPADATKFIYVGQGAKRDRDHRSEKSSFGRRFKKEFPGVELPQPVREQVEVSTQIELNELETIWMFQHHTWRGYEGGMNLTVPGSVDYKVLGHIGGLVGGHNQPHEARVANGHKRNELYGNPGTSESRKKGGCKYIELYGSPATQEGCSKGGRIGGRIVGRKAVESGQLARIRELPQSKEAQGISGRKNVESGHLARVNELPQTKKARQENGRKNVESGHLVRVNELPQTKEAQRINIRITCCLRWNIRRGKPCVCGKHDVRQAA